MQQQILFEKQYIKDAARDVRRLGLCAAHAAELAKKYDYVFVADWHQTAIDNPQIWEGTDYVHFGSNSESIIEGGTLYANTIKQAIDEANSGNVKP